MLHTLMLLAALHVPAQNVDVTPDAITCKEGQASVPVRATISRGGRELDRRAEFFSKNTAIAGVTRTGDRTASVRCKTAGRTYIGAGYRNSRDSARTTVTSCVAGILTIIPDSVTFASTGLVDSAEAEVSTNCATTDTLTPVTWISRNSLIFTVEQLGPQNVELVSVGAGRAYLYAQASNGTIKDSIPVCVAGGAGIDVTPPSLAVNVGLSGQLTATQTADCTGAAAGSVTWTSRNASVFTISASGVVTGVANGSAYAIGAAGA